MHVKPCDLGWSAGWLVGKLTCTCSTCPGSSGRLICTCFTCPGGSGRLICTCFMCPGGSGRLICTYFTCPGSSGRVQPLTNLNPRVGPLPKDLRPEASEALRLAEARVLIRSPDALVKISESFRNREWAKAARRWPRCVVYLHGSAPAEF